MLPFFFAMTMWRVEGEGAVVARSGRGHMVTPETSRILIKQRILDEAKGVV